MSIEFTLTKRQQEIREAVHALAAGVVRPECLSWDKNHGVPDAFLKNLSMIANNMGHLSLGAAEGIKGVSAEAEKKQGTRNLTTVIAAEEMAWGDGGLLLSLPGPGLGGPPVRAAGTDEQKERFSPCSATRRPCVGARTRSRSRARAATWRASARAVARTASTGS